MFCLLSKTMTTSNSVGVVCRGAGPLLLIIASVATLAAGQEPSPAQEVRIGVVFDGPWYQNEDVERVFQEELLTLTEDEFQTSFPPELRLVGDWSLPTTERA